MDIKKRNYIITIVLFIITILYIVLVKTIDVRAIGPNNSEVGFATINEAVKDTIGVNMTWYDITKYTGYLAIALAVFYACYGLIDLVKKKSLLKVDKKIIALGVFYVVVLAIYVLFEIVVINYRPVLIDGELEASFPSSHTMLALCICGSSLLISKYFVKNGKARAALNVVATLLMIVTLGGRIISGVHWISDIIGGVIISAFLLMAFYTVINILVSKENNINKV